MCVATTIIIFCYIIMIGHPISITLLQMLADIREKKTGIRENKYKKIIDNSFNNFERDILLFFVIPMLIVLTVIFITAIRVIIQ